VIAALRSLYLRRFGHEPASVLPLRADGSNRAIFRLVDPDGSTVIGVHGPDHDENRAFLSYSRSFRSIGIPVPEIYADDEAAGVYLEEDLGDTTLYDLLTSLRTGDEFPEAVIPVYHEVIALLPRIQVEGGKVIDFSVAYPRREFDRQSMMWDLNYFKYHFLKLARIPFHEARLEVDFERLCDLLLDVDRSHFLYRDFQSRNILPPLPFGHPLPPKGGPGGVIDYQGGRRGALQYDIASLLYDAKAAIPDPLRTSFLSLYLDELERLIPVDRDRFVEVYRGYVLIRIMQAMGAYGYRGFFEGKEHFLASVPYAVRNIETILAAGPLPVDLPELGLVFERIAADERLRDGRHVSTISASRGTVPVAGAKEISTDSSDAVPEVPPEVSSAELTVRIGSFSYRRGYPEESSEHGGGFVFDCRAIHNPGRYEEYRALCGQDTAVIEFLEREESVEPFWRSVSTLVDQAVETYLRRGFRSLSVSFGCTGGQHRSVYFAERLARHLRERFPHVTVELAHREQERWVRA
jgi:aminoglycoside/choline kinase family phosphotransferase